MNKFRITLSFFAVCLGLSASTAFAGERLTTNQLKELFLDTSITYDYGDLIAYAYTENNGDNYFDMNGHAHLFGEREQINQTKAKIKDQKICFHDGWVVCWTVETTDKPGLYIGRHAGSGDFIARVQKSGEGDVRGLKKKYESKSGV